MHDPTAMIDQVHHVHRVRRHSRLWLPFVIGALGLAVIGTPAVGQLRLPDTADRDRPLTADRLVKVRVVADVPEIEAGATFHLAVIFDIAPEWHIYWTDPGIAGAPTEVTVRAPLGYTVGETRYPRPETIVDPAGDSYGYHREVVLFVPVTAPPRMMPGLTTVSFDVVIQYFVCRERCLIGRVERSVAVPVAGRVFTHPGVPAPATSDRPPLPDARITGRYMERLPRPLAEINASATIDRSKATPYLVITGATEQAEDLSFLPIGTPGLTCGEPEIEIDGDRFVLRIALEVRRQNTLGRRPRVRGLLTIGQTPEQPSYDVSVDLDPPPLRNRSR